MTRNCGIIDTKMIFVPSTERKTEIRMHQARFVIFVRDLVTSCERAGKSLTYRTEKNTYNNKGDLVIR